MSKKGGRKGLDWEPVRAEYVHGSIGEDGGRRFLSYKDLAKKYGVSSSTLSQRGKAEEWPKQRDEARRNVAEAIDREAELTKSQLGKVIDENLQYFLVRYMDKIRLMVNIPGPADPRDVNNVLGGFQKLVELKDAITGGSGKGSLLKVLEALDKGGEFIGDADDTVENTRIE
jgi:hypothetical protein